ncbi:MAG: M48 family metalloprotease, partial [Pirellulaceae bacterium]
GVVGHELAHLDRQHQLLPLQRSKRLESAFREPRAMNWDQMMRSASLLMSGFMQPFRPEDEAEADRDGATWVYRANYDPRELAELFVRLGERNRAGQLMPSFLRTHPYPGDRQEAIQELYEELQRTDPRDDLLTGRDHLRRRSPAGTPRRARRAG